MNKITFIIVLFSFTQMAMAEQCSALYKKKADEIEKAGAYDVSVGGGPYIDGANNIRISPGMPIPGKVDNWARDFLEAVEHGPYTFIRTSGTPDPRKEWLESFKKSVKSKCPLKDDSGYTGLRSMLKELITDGSFCPDSKILEPIKLSSF